MRRILTLLIVAVAVLSASAQVKENIVQVKSLTQSFTDKYNPQQLIRFDSALYSLTHKTLIGYTLKNAIDSGWVYRVGDGNSAGTWTDNGNEKQTSVRDTIVAPVWFGNYWTSDVVGNTSAYLRNQGGVEQFSMKASDGTWETGIGGEVDGSNSYTAINVNLTGGQQRSVYLDSTGLHNNSTPTNLGSASVPWDTVFYSALYPPIAGPDSSVYATHYYVDTSVASRVYNVMTNPGDMIRLSSDGVPERLAVGTNGQVLTSNGTLPVWSTPSGVSSDSVPWRRDNTRATTSLRYPSDKVHIGAATTPDSTLKVTGGVNVTGGLNVGYDAVINGVRVGKGGGNNSGNTVFGNFAIVLNTTGSNNTAIGKNSMYANTTGNYNTALGYGTLTYGTSYSENTIIGYNAGGTMTGSKNVGIGFNSIVKSSGSLNTAIGHTTLTDNTTGYSNVAVGNNSLRWNTTGYRNIALGDSAGYAYTTLSNRMYLGARDTTGTTGGIYFDRTPAKRWGKWMGTLKVTDIPADAAPDSVLTVVDGLIKRAAFPTGGSGTVTSISQGTGMLNSSDPITTTGTIGVDTSKVVMFTDTSATGGKIATSYALTTGLAGKQAAGTYVTSVGATSPVASSGGTTPTVSINTDTLTAWHTKQNKGATAYSWGDPYGVYEPIIDPVPIAPGNYYAKNDGAGQTLWQEFPVIPAAYDTSANPFKYLSGNTVQRGTGNVGIGTTAPAAKVHISAPKAVALAISTDNDGSLGDSTAIYVNSRGYVGVGTASPVRAFHCSPNAQFDNLIYFGGTNNTLYSSGLAPSYNGVFKFSNESSGANSAFSFSTKATEAMRISPDQRIGIGTTTPTELLSLGGNAARKFWMERHTTANTAGNSLTIQAGGATSGATDKLGGPLYFYPGQSTGNATGTAYQWYTYDAGSTGTSDQTATAKMTMTSAGNLGIGTSAPGAPLQVVGEIKSDSIVTGLPEQIDTAKYYYVVQDSATGRLKKKEGYRVYTALLTQSGEDAPVATVLENTLGVIITWARDDVGQYHGTSSASIFSAATTPDISKYVPFLNDPTAYPLFLVGYADVDGVTFYVKIGNVDNGYNDGMLNNTMIEIRVYP